MLPVLLVVAVLLPASVSCGDLAAAPPPDHQGAGHVAAWSTAADRSTDALIEYYWDPQQQYFRYGNLGNAAFHYWPQAHALDVVLDAYSRTGDPKYRQLIGAWYEGVRRKNGGSFLKAYYDDMEWNALAMLRAYEVTDEEQFRAAVDTLWRAIKAGWTDVAGGGIMWSEGTPHSKNAISNAPASVLASRLYRLSGDTDDLAWARKTFAWQKKRLVEASTGAVWDHVVVENGTEEIRKDWIFTYNQGMFLAAALELYETTGDTTYLDDAIKAADFALDRLTTEEGLLVDEGDGDGGLFKGIFVRYLAQLILEEDLPAPTRNRYVAFLAHNAEALWEEGTNKDQILFGTYWGDRPNDSEEVDLTVQLGGAMLLEAVALLEERGLLDG